MVVFVHKILTKITLIQGRVVLKYLNTINAYCKILKEYLKFFIDFT